jgi:hypothetical protein
MDPSPPTPLERLFYSGLKLLRLESVYAIRRFSPPAEDGWFRSRREGAAVDARGEPIPWYTYPAIEFLAPRVRTDMTVLEYGSGNSTLWWAKRAARVCSVEHDPSWAARLEGLLPENVTLRHVPLDPAGTYARSAQAFGLRFDVVAIDGRERVECARLAPEALTERGVVVFDNSDRPDYAEGYAALADRGFRRIDFVGMAAVEPLKTSTSVFYRPGNCLAI